METNMIAGEKAAPHAVAHGDSMPKPPDCGSHSSQAPPSVLMPSAAMGPPAAFMGRVSVLMLWRHIGVLGGGHGLRRIVLRKSGTKRALQDALPDCFEKGHLSSLHGSE